MLGLRNAVAIALVEASGRQHHGGKNRHWDKNMARGYEELGRYLVSTLAYVGSYSFLRQVPIRLMEFWME